MKKNCKASDRPSSRNGSYSDAARIYIPLFYITATLTHIPCLIVAIRICVLLSDLFLLSSMLIKNVVFTYLTTIKCRI